MAATVQLYESGEPSLLVYVNAHTLNLACKDPAYRRILASADLVLNDGAGVGMAARWKGAPFPENLNGSDFNPLLIEAAGERGWPVFFLGGRPGVAEEASEILARRFPGLRVAGIADGYFDMARSQAIAAEIKASGAGLLMVALGNPLQEVWLDAWLKETGARLGVGVGAFFDFTAGTLSRAPAWMNRAGIEWMYRLVREPRRLFTRYVIGNPKFLIRAKLDARRSRGPT